MLLIGLHFVPVTGWLKLVLYLIPYLLVGGETLVDACKGIYNRQPFDENLLMAVATIGAMVLGDYPEAVSVMLFYQIGELFESYAVGRSRKNIGDLMDIRPDFAYVETADGIVRVKPEEVAVGDTIVVKPGERVPLDGTVLTGTSALNMSALTGESAPVDVAEGSGVVSGSVNLSGVLRLRVEKVYAESTVARILELVENSSLKKAHTERFITKFARVYTPSVCGAALALAILPPVVRLIMGIPADWGEWIYRALTFLVISCPCALVISIPLSFFGGIGGASARGILIKGSSYLEMLAKTDRVVFDKTGTLTRGTFSVTGGAPRAAGAVRAGAAAACSSGGAVLRPPRQPEPAPRSRTAAGGAGHDGRQRARRSRRDRAGRRPRRCRRKREADGHPRPDRACGR